MAGERKNAEGLVGVILEQLCDCGERGSQCRVLRYLMGDILREMGPWKLAHHLITSAHPEGANAFLNCLRKESAYEVSLMELLIHASRWEAEASDVVRDFGAA